MGLPSKQTVSGMGSSVRHAVKALAAV